MRAAVRELLKRHDDNQSLLAPKLGITQSALSGFISGRQGSSYGTARRAAQLLALDVEQMIEGTGPAPEDAPVPDRYPNRAKAAAFARGEIRDDAIERVLSMDLEREDDLPASKWLDMMRYWAEQLDLGVR